jgi:polysaccharide biosynthesis protein VpsQ
MQKSLICLFFICVPIPYMMFIWWQSSHFNPETFFALTSEINMSLFLFIGACLELAHLFEFGFLYLFLIFAFLAFGPLNKRKEITALIISLLYGVIDEIHQHYVPYRTASMNDVLKDTIGVLVIYWIVHKCYFNNEDSRFGSFLRKISNLTRKDKHDVTF